MSILGRDRRINVLPSRFKRLCCSFAKDPLAIRHVDLLNASTLGYNLDIFAHVQIIGHWI